MARSGLAGPSGSLTTGIAFGVPPLLKFGSKQLQERFLPDLLLGKKRTCIAITEPGAGSDVANIQTTAVKTEDGKHYIVNGTKKWYIRRWCVGVRADLWQDHQRDMVGVLLHGCSHRRTWSKRPLNAPRTAEGLSWS